MKNEDDLKLLLLEKLSNDFDFKTEVRGINLVEKKIVIIDFLAKAKRHVVGNGFTDEWFGIEVKYIPPLLEEKRMKQVIWQSITYAQSEYGGVRPPFVFIHTNEYNTDDSYHEQAIRGALTIAQYGNVGTLQADSSGYRFYFDNSYYWKNADGWAKGKHRGGQVRYCGNMLGIKEKIKAAKRAEREAQVKKEVEQGAPF